MTGPCVNGSLCDWVLLCWTVLCDGSFCDGSFCDGSMYRGTGRSIICPVFCLHIVSSDKTHCQVVNMKPEGEGGKGVGHNVYFASNLLCAPRPFYPSIYNNMFHF